MTVTERLDIPGTYTVQSRENTYNVDARDRFSVTCDCPAGCWSDRTCRHITRVLAFIDGEVFTEEL